jgi:hypothetical protein
MMINKMALPRRTFLRGMSATLALPFLDAMVPALTAITQTAAKPVMRMGFVYVPNGIQLVNWMPSTEGRNFDLRPVLAPLAPFRDQLTIVSGLSNPGEMLDDGGGAHTRPHTMWLSGVRPKRTLGGDIEAGPTIDQIAADELGKDTPLRSLELALEPNFLVGNCETGFNCTYMNTFSWRTATTPMPMENNPRVVFERLFGDGGTGAARLAEIRTDRSILDSVLGDINRLQRVVGPTDRRTIDAYVESIRDVERRLQLTETRAAMSPEMEGPLGIPHTFREHAELMFDLQFLAYQADITRVVSYQIARELSSRAYPEVGVAEAHHDVSHHQNNPERMEKNTRINAYHVEMFARLVKRMHDTPDGDGTLLDHAILMYGAGMGDGDQHSPWNLPVALVGGGCGQLAGGRHLKYPLETPMMNLGLALLGKVGVDHVERLGTSTGPLTEL